MTKEHRPELSDVHALLRDRNALVVHFSGAPPGSGKDRGKGHLFPSDLQYVAAGHAQGGLSCSVVFPGDNFYGVDRNATGCVGVVVRFRSPDSLVSATPADVGSVEDAHGVRHAASSDGISIIALQDTLEHRRDYNEWVVRDYEVVGILAVEPLEVWGEISIDGMDEEVRRHFEGPSQMGIIATSFLEVCAHFPEQTVYTFDSRGMWRRDRDGWVPSSAAEIYG